VRPSFIGKLLERADHLDNQELRTYFLRLAEERGLFETVFNTLQDGVIVLDSQGRMEYGNRAGRRLLGLPDEGFTGEPIAKYLRGLDWNGLLAAGQAVTRDLEIEYPEHRILQLHVLPMDEWGAAKGSYAAVFHDTTQQHTATQEAVESERMQALTLLAASVAHELGNPLNSLHIHLQLMERDARKAPGELAKRLSESIRVARGEIDRLDSIISQFLKAIRPTRPELRPVRPELLARETLELLRHELENRNILIEEEFPADLPEIQADSEQLKQAMYNIVKNAMQAMGQNGILRLSAEVRDDHLILSFTDNGPGIAAENLPHVLEPYYTTKSRGSGLGLMIVHRIMREHGGELELESTLQKGTTVRLKLPLQARRVKLLSYQQP
jgi:PAS domain S-box-containing protein